MSDFLFDGLNEAQKKAVLHKNGPLLILAGAGTGKTRAISHRVAYLVSQGVPGESILAITFTNKAAGEMRERINSLVAQVKAQSPQLLTTHYSLQTNSNPFVSTFHSLGVHILRKSGEAVGVPKNFSILDKGDSLSIVKAAIKELSLDPKQFQPQKLLSVISGLKGDLISPDKYLEMSGSNFFPSVMGKVWMKYEEQLKKQKALDFDDLILKTVNLFETDKATAEYYQNLWKFVVIDEYQDTNKGQYRLSKFLAEKHHNICAIGDIDQSIYGFRGADYKNILNFEKDFPEHEAIVFEQNYRSTQNILDAAGSVIEKNKFRKPKNLVAIKAEGEKINLYEAFDEEDEANHVILKIKELQGKGTSLSEMAILFRANFQSRAFEECCIKNNLPYQMLGTRFYDRKEIKDILAYIKLAMNRDDLTSFERAINAFPRGIGDATVLKHFSGEELTGAAKEKMANFLSMLDRIQQKLATLKVSEAVKFAIEESGYKEYLEKEGVMGEDRLENLQELVTIASRYDEFGAMDGLERFLSDAALAGDQDNMDEKQDKVRLMTVHAAKGLEFDFVFVVGMEDGLFPHSMTRMESAEKQEEERRLFYVAITRAKEKLFLSFAVFRNVYGSRQINDPSPFLTDIPEELYNYEKNTGRMGGEGKVIEYL